MMILLARFFVISLALTVICLTNAAWSAPDTTQNAPAKRKEIPLSGKVMETMDGGGYTYILLNNGNEQNWVAVPLMKVTVGMELKLVPGYEMKNFTSKGMNRKFEKIIFSSGLANQPVVLSPQALKMAHQGVPQAALTQPSATKSDTVALKANARVDMVASSKKLTADLKASSKNVKITKAKGRNAYTIAELYAKKTKLEKKPVVIRGKVVKVNARILKRNWVHIQDGSGSAAKKTDNLILTTNSKDLPNIGDIVTVKGILYNNIDFGSGYRYGLIVEGAKFSR
ncbi:MAG: DNA-binding protein [Desulfuromonadales bacterium]|nr:DNA-binding protein [Desulfuromonadales bacterium]